jgi:hypothetical protein
MKIRNILAVAVLAGYSLAKIPDGEEIGKEVAEELDRVIKKLT